MEVAGHWRREWAGTAEYGKVTEGGVTRRVARAMEVVNASAPGARVRVVRAAYHSSAGHGAPASSYLMHSSRTVLSSGFNLLESPSYPSLPSKPLEISSTPLESSPEPNTDTENYKVTEPDDFDISEPSKWKSSSNRNSMRMPSEESSSTDNASVIDLDSRQNLLRKYSYDSENSDIPTYRRNSARASPLLDTPAALSTLKYKSLLLNGSSDWNNRRKSYSFEDTSPLNETIVHSNDTLAMESSTDSGICKSTEIVNDTEDRYLDRKERKYDLHEETFKDWLSKNRSTNSSFYKGKQTKSFREHGVVVEEPPESAVALQSKGKVSITVPMTVADDYEYKKSNVPDDGDRKVKKVEFCKTELHFTADTGKVNIIATDEKPPPSSDFRKRRSAFVPMHSNFEKPITLFGESTKEFLEVASEFTNNSTNELGEYDENTAATKSILKNKIPKPKPYLLGENMGFGCTDESTNKTTDSNYDSPVSKVVSLINRQLLERRSSDETGHSFVVDRNANFLKKASRTTSTSPQPSDSLKQKRRIFETTESVKTNEVNLTNSVKNKLKTIQLSPVDSRAKTRQLRDSELTYFGVNKDIKSQNGSRKREEKSRSASSSIDDLFHSVNLVRKASNSVCNSEAESEDSPEYQNIPLKTNFAPIPTPRPRSKFDSTQGNDLKVLRPVIEQDDDSNVYSKETRRSRFRKLEETSTTSRSISEPPKARFNSTEKSYRRNDLPRSTTNCLVGHNNTEKKKVLSVKRHPNINISEEEEPPYVNFGTKLEGTQQRSDSIRRNMNRSPIKIESPTIVKEIKTDSVRGRSRNFEKETKDKLNILEKTRKTDIDVSSTDRKPARKTRTEKLATPEYSTNDSKCATEKIYGKTPKTRKLSNEVIRVEDSVLRSSKSEHRSRSSNRNKNKPEELPIDETCKSYDRKDMKPKETNINGDTKYHAGTSSKDRSSRRESSSMRKQVVNSNDSYRNSTKSSKNKENTSERVPSSKADYKSSNRSAYVINYDDKNGTVSSVCKVKPGSSASKKKPKDLSKDGYKEYKTKNKTSEKNALLQFPDEVIPYATKYEYADRKWKRKMHVQRTCQLL